MSQFLFEINWQLIIFIIVISGVLAYLGDVLGMRIAKKRISLFGLRPRHTSSIITVLTGILIAFGILAAMAAMSDTVRTALFSMKYIQRQVVQLTTDLQDSRDEKDLISLQLVQAQEDLEIEKKKLVETEDQLGELKGRRDELEKSVVQLQDEAKQLRQGLVQAREGRIVVFADELLGQESVHQGSTREDIEVALDRLRERARILIARRSDLPVGDVQLSEMEGTEEKIINRCLMIDSRKVIRVMAASNATRGEDLEISYRVFESTMVYRKGEILVEGVIEPDMDDARAEVELHSMLREANYRAVRDGILRDPVSRTVGQLDATDFFDAVESMTETSEPVKVTIRAAEDIYTEGPVGVTIRVEKND